MKTSNQGKEVVDLEWNRVTSIAWPTLSVIYGIQALLAEIPISKWQIIFLIGLAISLSVSVYLNIKKIIRFAYVPTILYLFLSPIVIGDNPKNSWMSIGLVTFAAVIYFGTIKNVVFAAAVVLLMCILQSSIASMNLASISDNLDINFFHSYFSFIWTFVIGFASIFIRRRYLSVTLSIQNYVEDEIMNSLNRLNKLKQVNEKDSRNLQLHGTILNTLIHIRNLLNQNQDISPILGKLKKEIDDLSSEGSHGNRLDFSRSLKEMISNRARNRIDVSISTFDGKLESEQVEDSVIEISRELILNAEKHTNATTASLTIRKVGDEKILIEFIDNALLNLDELKIAEELDSVSSSLSLQTLLNECGGEMKISQIKRRSLRKIVVTVPIINVGKELEKSISQSRLAGLNDFSLNFVRASALVGLLSLPGYFQVNLRFSTFLITCLSVLFTFISLEFLQHRINLVILATISLLIFPSLSINVESCTALLSAPWLFNHILTVAFLCVIVVKNRFLRWIPLVIFSLECIFYPLNYPTACENILLGSIPAIPLITVFGLGVIAIRKREVTFDHSKSIEISRLNTLHTDSDKFRESALEELLVDCHQFMEDFNQRNSEADGIAKLSLQIQKIQTFLVCSEHFDSIFIQRIYRVFRDAQNSGIPGRISLMGENIRSLDSQLDLETTIAMLADIKGNSSANLIVINNQSAEFHFEGVNPREDVDQINGIPVFFNP